LQRQHALAGRLCRFRAAHRIDSDVLREIEALAVLDESLGFGFELLAAGDEVS
jgi:hypothetical protein